MLRFARFLAAAGVAALSLSCADKSTGLRASGLAWLPITPVFSMAPEGGPRIGIAAVEAVLKRPGAADSNFANADVRGDSAILEFPRVIVMGDSSTFALEVRAFDANDELVFKAMEDIRVKPGDNAPTVPVLQYVAPDANVESIDVLRLSPDVTLPAQLVTEFDLDWAGGAAGNTSCLSRLPTPGAITQTQLTASGITATGPVANVRVGWTSRDTTVATVDANGVVRARCSSKSTYIVARTFLDVADSVRVDVTAVPFTLMMIPEAANVHREDSLQLAAVVVDENGNAMTTTGVSWNASDSSLATVSATGMVYGVRNGRVLITASSGNRTAVGVVQVVAPRASSVVVQPPIDTLVVGQSRLYNAAAFDAGGNRIPDAAGFSWGSDNSGIARVSASGVVTGVGPGDARIVVKLDGKKDTSLVHVRVATSGLATGSVIDAATGAALPGVSVNGQGTVTTDGNGQFTTMPQTPPTDLQFSATGYVGVMYYQVPVSLGQTVDLGDIPMVPVNANPSSLTGTVVNALNDAPVPSATVKLYPGIHAPSSNPSSGINIPSAVAQTMTDASGAFALPNVPPGTYTYSITATGFSFTRRIAVAVGGTQAVRIPLSPLVTNAPNGLRVVLSWGNCAGGSSNLVPCDLDAHLTGPASAPDVGRFHVAYFNEVYLRGLDTVAVLDNDATDGLGPETITLRPVASGAYKFYVHNYTDGADTTSLRLTTASARVDVYRGADLIATYFPPTVQPGTVWAVFQYDGTTLTAVNEILRIQDLSEVSGDFLRAEDPVREELRAIVRTRMLKP